MKCISNKKEAFNFKLFRTIEQLLKFMVIGGDALMTVHVACMLAGYEESWFYEYICGYSVCGFIALYLASYLLRFCWKYRTCLFHGFIVHSCIIFHREVGFGDLLKPMSWILLLLGIAITILIIQHEIHHHLKK